MIKVKKMGELSDKKKDSVVNAFFIHGFLLLTWTPLIWVISGDVLESLIEGYKYKFWIQWGCASSTVLINVYLMIRRLCAMGQL